MSERIPMIFDPASIENALKANLPDGLRALADAIDAGRVDGRFISTQGNGLFQDWRDTRLHVWVTVDIAAELYRFANPLGVRKVPLDCPPVIMLPAPSPKGQLS